MGSSEIGIAIGSSAVIEFHPQARAELREATIWYGERSSQVAARFVEQVTGAVDRIAVDPDSHPKIGRGYHYVRVSRFPYLLVFRVTESANVIVTAVAHTSRQSDFWQKRN